MQQAAEQAAEAAPIQAAPLPPVVPGRVLHMDGDLLCYWAGGNEETTVGESRQRAITKINALRDHSGSESVVLHLTAESSTKGDRRLIATVKGYQAQRKSGRRPKNWGYLRHWTEGYEGALFRSKLWATREADDGMALCCTDWFDKSEHEPGGRCLVALASGDKDLRMVPAFHVNWSTFETTQVDLNAFDVMGTDGLQYGHKWFWLQMLQGDTADNIPGLPFWYGKKCGSKTAEAALSSESCNQAAFDSVFAGYEAEYGDTAFERFVEQGLLLWMRRDPAGSIRDFQQFLLAQCIVHVDGTIEAVTAEFDRVEARIKEKYAEAQSLGSCGVQSDVA